MHRRLRTALKASQIRRKVPPGKGGLGKDAVRGKIASIKDVCAESQRSLGAARPERFALSPHLQSTGPVPHRILGTLAGRGPVPGWFLCKITNQGGSFSKQPTNLQLCPSGCSRNVIFYSKYLNPDFSSKHL